MGEITTVGLDLAKQVFQVHAVDAAGQVVLREAFGRIEHVALQMANALEDLFAGKPMIETEGAHVPPATFDLGRPQARRQIRLGPARPRVGTSLSCRRTRPGRGLR